MSSPIVKRLLSASIAIVFAFAAALWMRSVRPPPMAGLAGPSSSDIAGFAVPGSTGSAGADLRLPPFHFVDQHGHPVSEDDLLGHVWIFDMVYTTCTTVCPTITAKLALLERKLPSPDLRFVSFSVDPEHDTVAALARYAARFRPDESRWLLLRTDPQGLAALASDLGVAVSATTDPDNKILHSGSFFLVDRTGSVYGRYDTTDPNALAQLASDATVLTGDRSASPADESGAALVMSLGCNGCHERPELAPSLGGLWGRTVELEGGKSVKVDEAYLKRAIVAPRAELVRGYLDLMPAYGSELSPAALDALVKYVKDQPAPSAEGAGAAPSGSTGDASVARDPVCGMSVRVVPTTPHRDHAGHRFYFCSDTCAESFARDPERYARQRPAGTMTSQK